MGTALPREQRMKAVQISRTGGPEVLELVDLPVPRPGPGEVLVKTVAIGVGKPDVLLRTGVYRWMPKLPAILGNEMSGHVEAVGSGVAGLTVGQKVLVFGTGGGRYAEYNAVPQGLVTPLPDSVDLDAAVALPNYFVAWAMLREAARGIDARTLYVNGGAGGMGTAIIDVCRAEGIAVIAGASTAEKCAFARKAGATHTVEYGRENVVDRVLELTGGRGIELMFDQLVGPDFTDNFRMLVPLGMIVTFNALAGLPQKETFSELRANLGKSLAVRAFSWHAFDHDRTRAQRVIATVVGMFGEGRFDPPIHARLPLTEARKAHEMLDARAIMGKLVLKP